MSPPISAAPSSATVSSEPPTSLPASATASTAIRGLPLCRCGCAVPRAPRPAGFPERGCRGHAPPPEGTHPRPSGQRTDQYGRPVLLRQPPVAPASGRLAARLRDGNGQRPEVPLGPARGFRPVRAARAGGLDALSLAKLDPCIYNDVRQRTGRILHFKNAGRDPGAARKLATYRRLEENHPILLAALHRFRRLVRGME